MYLHARVFRRDVTGHARVGGSTRARARAREHGWIPDTTVARNEGERELSFVNAALLRVARAPRLHVDRLARLRGVREKIHH